MTVPIFTLGDLGSGPTIHVSDYTLDGPSAASIGLTSDSFFVTLGVGTLDSPVTITPDDGGAGGGFSVGFVTLTDSHRTDVFSYTPLATGTIVISVTNDAGFVDPGPRVLTVSSSPWLGGSSATDMIKNGMKQLLMPTFKKFASQQVVYRRGTRSVTVAATFGPQKKRLVDQFEFDAVKIDWTDLDFIIAAEDLHFGDGALVTPIIGDKIFVAMDLGGIQVYEVLPFGDKPAWRWSGANHLLYRIHTKNVRTIRATL